MVVGTTVIASFVPTRIVGTAVPASVVGITAIERVVPTRFVGTAFPAIIVLTAYYWKSCSQDRSNKNWSRKDILNQDFLNQKFLLT